MGRFAILGFERGGTKYAAEVFSAAGVRCAHEVGLSFSSPPFAAWPAECRGVSSWMAAAFVDRLRAADVVLLYQRRCPACVLTSWARHGSFTDEAADYPYYASTFAAFPTLAELPSGWRRWLSLLRTWHAIGVDVARYSWRVETLDAGTLCAAAAGVGNDVAPELAAMAIANTPSRLNSRLSPPPTARYAAELQIALERIRDRHAIAELPELCVAHALCIGPTTGE